MESDDPTFRICRGTFWSPEPPPQPCAFLPGPPPDSFLNLASPLGSHRPAALSPRPRTSAGCAAVARRRRVGRAPALLLDARDALAPLGDAQLARAAEQHHCEEREGAKWGLRALLRAFNWEPIAGSGGGDFGADLAWELLDESGSSLDIAVTVTPERDRHFLTQSVDAGTYYLRFKNLDGDDVYTYNGSVSLAPPDLGGASTDNFWLPIENGSGKSIPGSQLIARSTDLGALSTSGKALTGSNYLISDNYLEVEAAMADAAPELVLGTQMERHSAKRLGIPCAVISSPLHVQDVPARYAPQMGWEGANVIFDSWVHPLMMGLEEHLIGMFRHDFEFVDGHMSHKGEKPPGPQEADPITLAAEANGVDEAELLRWAPSGQAELSRIPFFVRGKVKRNTESYAQERGIVSITDEVLYEAKAHFSR